MCVGARQLCAVLLLSASLAWTSKAMADIPTTQPATATPLFPNNPDPSDLLLVQSQTTLPLDDSGKTPTANDPATRPVTPEVINNPLPPAFWSGMSVLILASLLVAWRRVRRQLW